MRKGSIHLIENIDNGYIKATMNNVTWAMLGLPTTAIARKRRQRARVPSAPPVLAPLSLLGPGLDLDADNNVLNDTPRVPSVAPPPIPHRSHSNPIPRSLIKKLSLSSSPTSSSSFSLWSRRRTQPTQPPPPLLPLVRVTSPFTVDMVRLSFVLSLSPSSHPSYSLSHLPVPSPRSTPVLLPPQKPSHPSPTPPSNVAGALWPWP